MTVRYCPGSACGSPAWLNIADANAYLAQDTRVLEKLADVDSLTAPVVPPHIGRCSRDCQHRNTDT